MFVDSSNEILMAFVKTATQLQLSLRKESERGSAIVCAALLDESLQEILKANLVALSKKKDELFDVGAAPFESFAAKIDVAYRIGLISRDEKLSFHLIRKIRNDFAHTSEDINFESIVVKNRICELFNLNNKILNIFANAAKRIPKTTYKWPNKLDNTKGLDFLVKAVGWKTVYEIIGSMMAASIKLRCRRVKQIKPYINNW